MLLFAFPLFIRRRKHLDADLKNILSFGYEKLNELKLIVDSLNKAEVSEEAKEFNNSFQLSNKQLRGELILKLEKEWKVLMKKI